jgi:hypothetical protein
MLAGCASFSEAESTPAPTPTDTPEQITTPVSTETPTQTSTETPTSTGPAAFEVVSTDGPEIVTVGDEMQLTATIRNTGGESGTFQTTFEGSVLDQDEWIEQYPISLEISPGETRIWASSQFTPTRDNIGTLQYRLSGTAAEWEITIEPESMAPEIQEVNLVDAWESYGDAINNPISSASIGDEITVAWRYEYIITDGRLKVFEQCRIYNMDTGDRVDNRTYVDEQIFSEDGYTTFEHGFDFDTTDWEAGEYRAEVTIRDEVSGEVSNTETTTFELT